MTPDEFLPTDGDVYVSPRYLASSTGFGDPALGPLLDLGWHVEDDELCNVYVSSPDHKVRLGYLPEGEDDGLWRINAYKDPFGPPTWGVCFNESAPDEVVHAFTTALAKTYEQGPDACLVPPDPRHSDRDPFLAVLPLINRGWQLDRPRPGIFATQSPDRLARLELTGGQLDPTVELSTRDARWHLWVGTSVDFPAWYATASTDTPVSLLKVVTECVADPDPVLRWREDTHSYLAGVARVTSMPPPRPARPRSPTPLDVQRATTRKPAVLNMSAVPRWSTASRPAVPGTRR
ncbi:DUF317 domain-containing protein [Streptomyces lydicus]